MFDPKKMMDMLKNASEMQKNLESKLKLHKVTGESGGGMVKVLMNGQFELESLEIDEKLLKEDKKFVEDLIKASINDATRQLKGSMQDQLKSLLGGFGF